MIEAFHSNRLEVLAMHLGNIIQHDPTDVFQREVVLVESSAMSSWLMQQITLNNGIAADIEFPFPASFIWQIYRAQCLDLPQISHFDRQPLAFRLYQYFYPLLNKNLVDSIQDAEKQSFEKKTLENNSRIPLSKEVALFIEQLSDKRQLFEYCEYLSGLYDQYQIYRPELLKSWQKSRSNSDFQAMIWYDLHQMSSMKDRAEIFFDVYEKKQLLLNSLNCKRLHLFALNNLPAAYFSLFEKIAETMDVFIYVLNPCVHFWGDIQSEKGKVAGSQMPDTVQMESNPLLALMARQGQEFIQILGEQNQNTPIESFIDQDAEILLSHLQSDILHLRMHPPEGERQKIELNDNSVVIHQCHHPLREVEILKNQILHFLSQNPDSELENIAVMVADLDRYAPYFDSVFLHQGEHLPFHLAERHSKEHLASDAILSLIQASIQGFTRSSVLDCLRNPQIQQRFELFDIGAIEQLLDSLSVHFGLEDAEWEALGEGVVSMAFEQAMDRLMLSFAADADPILSAPAAEQAIQWGCFIAFIDQLAAFNKTLHEKSPKAWVTTIQTSLLQFVDQSEREIQEETRIIFEALDKWLEMIAISEFDLPIDLPTFQISLEGILEAPPSQHFFRKGCVNIATLLPMRNLPFDMIALLGMNDGVFPPQETIDPQDQMKVSPKLGDRNRTTEARYLFLQSLLSARKKWMVCYQGFNAFDNSETFPSVLLTELLDHLDRGFVMSDGSKASDGLKIRHPLQPFDPIYFKERAIENSGFEAIKSFDREMMSQSLALLQQEDKVAFEQPIEPENREHWSLKEFRRAIVTPQKWYLSCLGIFLRNLDEEAPDREMMESSSLSRYNLLSQLLDDELLTTNLNAKSHNKSVHKLQGLLTQGQLGEKDWHQVGERKDILLGKIEDFGIKTPLEWKMVSLFEEGAVQVEGRLSGFVSEQKRLAFVGKEVKGDHILRVFIEHVLYQKASNLPLTSVLVGEKESYQIHPIADDALAFIFQALESVAEHSQSTLTHVFPRSSFNAKKKDDSMDVFKESLFGDRRNAFPESDKPHFHFLYKPGGIPVVDAFERGEQLFSLCWPYLEEIKPAKDVKRGKA